MNTHNRNRLKHWEIIADNLRKAGWSLGYVSEVDCGGRTIWIADAHRGDGKRFVVHAEKLLTAFIELEAAIRAVTHKIKRGLHSGQRLLAGSVALMFHRDRV